MKLYIRLGRLRYITWQDVLPTFGAVDITEDDPPYRTVYRWYSITWLRFSVNLDVPTCKTRRFVVLSPLDAVRRFLGFK